MKVVIDKDEWWPVYVVEEPGSSRAVVDVPEEFLTRHEAARKVFLELNNELGRYMDENT